MRAPLSLGVFLTPWFGVKMGSPVSLTGVRPTQSSRPVAQYKLLYAVFFTVPMWLFLEILNTRVLTENGTTTLPGNMAGWLAGWLAGFAGWLAGWLCWLAGWLAGWLIN